MAKTVRWSKGDSPMYVPNGRLPDQVGRCGLGKRTSACAIMRQGPKKYAVKCYSRLGGKVIRRAKPVTAQSMSSAKAYAKRYLGKHCRRK